MPTRTRLKLEGPCLAFVTTTVTGWVPLFNDKRPAEAALDQFRQALAHYSASCMAYVLMPSHLHALVGVNEYTLIARLMQGFKILTAKRLKPVLGENLLQQLSGNGRYHFWKPRYDELVVTGEKQFRIKVEYIHANPVRAGLVQEAINWVYSSARDWAGLGRGIVPLDRTFSFQQ